MRILLNFTLLTLFIVFQGCYKYPFASKVPNTQAIQEGQVLYMQYCQKCHPDGEAGLGPSIYYLPGFMKKFQTRHGLGVMPEFKEKIIADEELDKLVKYLNSL